MHCPHSPLPLSLLPLCEGARRPRQEPARPQDPRRALLPGVAPAARTLLQRTEVRESKRGRGRRGVTNTDYVSSPRFVVRVGIDSIPWYVI